MTGKSVLKPRLSAQERRASIVEAALKLFGEKGFRGTTTRELAAAVGVTEPVLYEHFRTKSELYTAIIDAKSQVGLERMREVTERYRERDDDYGFFSDIAQMILDLYILDPAYIRLLLFSGLEGHELKELFHQRQSRIFFEMVGAYLQRRITAGGLRPEQPQVMAEAFTGMIAHYGLSRVLYSCEPEQPRPEDVVPRMVRMFLDGVAMKANGYEADSR